MLFVSITSLTWWISEPRGGVLNIYLSIVWSLYAPIAVIGILGSTRTRRLRPAAFEGRVETPVIFLLPTIARPGNLPALRRVVASILAFAPRHLENYRIDLVTDEGAAGIPELEELYADEPHVRLIVVPEDYTTPNNTRYKARANQYALELRDEANESRADVFVYHLDDDTGINVDTVAAIARFVHEDDGTYDLAQGALAYPHDLAESRFTVYADSVRPADDFTRFQFFTGVINRPLGGLHGEHLLLRGSVESAIGWDFGETKVEDAKFALHFVAEGHRSTFLRGFSYGASPASIAGLVKQRRRWAGGLIALAFDGTIPLRYRLPLAYSVLTWATGMFQHLGLVLAIALATGAANTSPVWDWLLFVWGLNVSYILWQYMEGLKANLTATRGSPRFWPRALLLVPGIFVFSAVEAYSAFLGLYDLATGKSGFDVIAKPT